MNLPLFLMLWSSKLSMRKALIFFFICGKLPHLLILFFRFHSWQDNLSTMGLPRSCSSQTTIVCVGISHSACSCKACPLPLIHSLNENGYSCRCKRASLSFVAFVLGACITELLCAVLLQCVHFLLLLGRVTCP